MKKIISILISFAIVLSMIPAVVSASTDECPNIEGGIHEWDETLGKCYYCSAWQPAELVTGKVDTYIIRNAGNLYWFAEGINNFELPQTANLWIENDIDMGQYVPFNAATYEFEGDLSLLQKWTPIGNSPVTAYRGTLYGNGHTISGLYCNGYDAVGFFGYTDGATIQDLRISNSYFKGSERVNGDYIETTAVGALAGIAHKTTFKNCRTDVGVVSDGFSDQSGASSFCIGSFVGRANIVTVTNCESGGVVKAISDAPSQDVGYGEPCGVGGLFGIVTAETNYGAILAYSHIEDSAFYGSIQITGAANVGYIAGQTEGGVYRNVYGTVDLDMEPVGFELFSSVGTRFTVQELSAKKIQSYELNIICEETGSHQFISYGSFTRCYRCNMTCENHSYSGKNCTVCGTNIITVQDIVWYGAITECFENDTFGLSTGITPYNASFQDIQWSVERGSATFDGSNVTATAAGDLVLKATIKNGSGWGKDFTKTFALNVLSKTLYDISNAGSGYSDALVITQDGNEFVVHYNQNEARIPLNETVTVTGNYSNESSYFRIEVVGCTAPVKLQLRDCSIATGQSVIDIKSSCTVNLELDGTNQLTACADAFAAVSLGENAVLNIGGDGILTAKSTAEGTGIGNSHYYATFGTININYGTIYAYGGKQAAGIGTGYGGQNGTVNINGGTVYAYGGSSGAGIGSGSQSQAGIAVTINGGTVNAVGSYGATGSNSGGAGIGGGFESAEGAVTVNGGTVYAEAGINSAGIGSGEKGTFGNILITGGTVVAKGSRLGAAIGGGLNGNAETITLTGGNISASGRYAVLVGSGQGGTAVTPTDGKGNAVSQVVLTLDGAAENTAITAFEGISYGAKDVKTLDTNKLYVYLPAGAKATAIVAGGTTYSCESELTYYATHGQITEGKCDICGQTLVEIAVDKVVLKPTEAGVYFKGTFSIRQDVAVDRYGIALSLYNSLPVADDSDAESLWTEDANSVLVSNILDGGADDAQNGKKVIYARAYVLLKDGTYLYSDVVEVSLQQLVMAVDTKWDTLTAAQKEAYSTMYRTFEGTMSGWDLPNSKKQ